MAVMSVKVKSTGRPSASEECAENNFAEFTDLRQQKPG
jgi:hypothetical protein